jgi:hypothetical protein
MNDKLEKWIAECVSKGTFKNRDDAIEFCVGATRVYCELSGLNQKTLKEHMAEGKMLDMPFPLHWTDSLDKYLRDTPKRLPEPMVTVSVEAKSIADMPKLIEVLRHVAKTDKSVQVEINQETGEHLLTGNELHIKIRENYIEVEHGIPIIVRKI